MLFALTTSVRWEIGMTDLFAKTLRRGKRYIHTHSLPIADIQVWDSRIMNSKHHSPKKRAYLRSCSTRSLKKRWWIFCVEGVLLYMAFGLSLWFFILAPVIILSSVAYIILDSRRRHLFDRVL